MSQLQDIFANEIHQAKKLTLFDTKVSTDSSLSKDIMNPLGATDLKAEPTDISAFQNLPELKVEATPSGATEQNKETPMAEPTPQPEPEPEKNRNLIMGLLKK